jgi:N,N'-diacetyllegionaminate synthase
MLKKLELSEKNFRGLKSYCDKKGIIFLSTPHTPGARKILKPLVSAYKVGSCDLTNYPFLKELCGDKKPLIISTGMADGKEIGEAVGWIKRCGNKDIVVLHCTTSYPCPDNEVNLNAIKKLLSELDVPVGFSDHTVGTEAAVIATTLGACVIEKHLTLDHNLAGPDHRASADPAEFQRLVNAVRSVPTMLGSGVKRPTAEELKTLKLVRKSVVTRRLIHKGERLTADNLVIKRPGNGIQPKDYYRLLGKIVRHDIKADVLLKKSDYEQE